MIPYFQFSKKTRNAGHGFVFYFSDDDRLCTSEQKILWYTSNSFASLVRNKYTFYINNQEN